MSSISQAASVLLARGPHFADVLLVRRADRLRFFGGFWAFPGGKVSLGDAGVPGAGLLVPRLVTAVRELFEETGVLLARTADGQFPAPSPPLTDARSLLIEERLSFAEFLQKFKLHLSTDDFAVLGEITTPEFAPIRFATTFFVAHLPGNQQVDFWPGELAEAVWTTPAEMLQRWRRGEALVSPPTVMTLQAIEGRSADEAPARLGPLLEQLAGGATHPIYFAPEVQLLPLRAPVLPPVQHTNAYLVGNGPRYLIDPGADQADEQQRLFDVLDAHQAAGRTLTAVVLTHHHRDHVGAATACAERYRVPIWAHPRTAQALVGRVAAEAKLADGDRLDLGPRPDGGGAWFLEALHTPGHAAGHLCFYDPFYRFLFAGDMISTATSVVIAPPDGDLGLYLESLGRLRDLPARLLLPAHGNVSSRPRQTIEDALQHRLQREAQLVAALAAGPRSVEELGPELYRGLPENLMPFAHLQIRAGLEKLRREGRAESADGVWRAKR